MREKDDDYWDYSNIQKSSSSYATILLKVIRTIITMAF
jgi:hypothetical protein